MLDKPAADLFALDVPGDESRDAMQLRQIVDNASVAMFVKDLDGTFLYVNRAFERLKGQPREAILGRTDATVFPEAADEVRRHDRRVIEERRPLDFEETVEAADGTRTWLAHKFPLIDADGDAYAVCGIATDISERKRAEEALRTAASAVSTDGGDAIFRDLTVAIARILAVDVAFIAVFVDERRDRMRTLAAMLDGKLLRNFEYDLASTPCVQVVGHSFRLVERGVRSEFPPGTIFEAKGMDSYAAYPLNDSAGQPLGLITTMARSPMVDDGLVESLLRIFAARAAAEIERRRTEQALRRSEASYRAIFEATEDAVFVLDWESGAFLDVNPKAVATFGWSADEFRTLSAGDLSSGEPPYTEAHAMHWIAQAKRGAPVTFEWRRRNRDRSLHWDEVTLKAAEVEGRPVILAFSHEITARKAAEEALRTSEEQYRTIFNAAVDGLALCDADGRFVDVNPAFTRMFGYERDALLGRDGCEVVGGALAEQCRGQFKLAIEGKSCRVELPTRRSDGAELDVEVRAAPIDYGGRPHALVTVRDQTAERAAERARVSLEARLRQAQKMEALGHLTGGIAHDFNNLLTTILGYVTLAAETSADAKARRYLGEARSASERARDLVAQMLTYSRGRRGDPRPVALDVAAGEVIRLLRSSFPSTVAIVTQVDADVPAVVVDRVQVEQVVMNLCINARDAIASRGEIRVLVRRANVEARACASCRAAVSGDYVELCVEDTGPGVPADVQERMFDPFYTTKEAGHGTGMGLATVHGIVHEHAGHVLYEAAEHGGARFRVLLPAAPDAPQALAVPAAASSFPRETLTGRVMVVDDEPAVAGFMADLLSEWGAEPRVFHDPRAALDALRGDPAAFDLVLTDQTMPGMTGLDLAQACRDVPGAPRVVLYTGYAEKLSRGAPEGAGVAALVRKPIDPTSLFATLKSHLRRDASAAAPAGAGH
jgi:PAS domain S-box-containing protein